LKNKKMKKILTILISLSMLMTQLGIHTTLAGTTDEAVDASTSGGADEEEENASASTDHDSTVLDSFSITTYLAVPQSDEAEGSQDQTYLTNDSEQSPLTQFILLIIKFLSQLIGTISMVLIIIGGMLMLASEGDDNRIQKGKTIITQAIIGLILALTSYILVTFVQSLLYVQT